MGAGSGLAGIYFDLDAPGIGYRMWISVAGEIAPTGAGRTLIQVPVAPGDSSMQAASDIAAAVTAISTAPFVITQIGNALQFETSAPLVVGTHITLSSGWGTANASVAQAGTAATGNYSAIRAALLSAAGVGQTQFTLTLPTTYQPSALRGNSMSSCNSNMSQPQGSSTPSGYQSYQRGATPLQSTNLLLQAYLSGIQAGMADQEIYDYEVSAQLNVSDTITTSINLVFNFQTT
jgi:hypothetical protein